MANLLHAKRTQLGGYLPRRETTADVAPVPALASYAAFATGVAGKKCPPPWPLCAVPESVRAFLPADRSYLTLCTDGFGRSDTRAALRG